MRAQPDFLIIGAQRGASTWLNSALRRHPQIHTPRREVPYFEDPWYDGGYDPLPAIARTAGTERIWGFKRPNLLGLPECPARIYARTPAAKLLMTLREPVARTVSAYYLYMRSGSLPLLPLNEGLLRILQGPTDPRYPWATEVITFSMYATHLRSYRRYFPSGAFCILLDDDIRLDPMGALRSAFEHLGVDSSRTVSLPARTNEGVYSLPAIRIQRLGSRLLYSRDPNGQFMRPRLGFLPRAAGVAMSVGQRILSRPASNRPESLDPGVRKQLIDRLAPDTIELERVLNRSLESWWASMDSR